MSKIEVFSSFFFGKTKWVFVPFCWLRVVGSISHWFCTKNRKRRNGNKVKKVKVMMYVKFISDVWHDFYVIFSKHFHLFVGIIIAIVLVQLRCCLNVRKNAKAKQTRSQKQVKRFNKHNFNVMCCAVLAFFLINSAFSHFFVITFIEIYVIKSSA